MTEEDYAQMGKKIFANENTYKEFISQTCKQFLQLNIKKQTTQ